MNNLDKAKQLKNEIEMFDYSLNQGCEFDSYGQFEDLIKETEELKEKIEKDIFSEKNADFIDKQLMKNLKEAKEICEEIFG